MPRPGLSAGVIRDLTAGKYQDFLVPTLDSQIATPNSAALSNVLLDTFAQWTWCAACGRTSWNWGWPARPSLMSWTPPPALTSVIRAQ